MSIAHRISAFNRARKWQIFLSHCKPTDSTTVLDVGFAEKEHSPVDNFIEKNYPYPQNITALGINPAHTFAQRYPAVRPVTYDGKRFPFADKEFDICWSNAVIEHVGDTERQLQFLCEIVRVSRRAFITTPNRLFPIETHTRTPLLHWLPKRAFDTYLRCIGKGWATGDYMSLLTQSSLRHLLTRAGVARYQMFHQRLAGFTLDFALVIDC